MHQVSVHHQQDCFLSLMKGKRAFYSKINPVPIPFLHSIERAANHCIVPVHWRDFKEESRRVPLSAVDVKEPLNTALAKGEFQGYILALSQAFWKETKRREVQTIHAFVKMEWYHQQQICYSKVMQCMLIPAFKSVYMHKNQLNLTLPTNI